MSSTQLLSDSCQIALFSHIHTDFVREFEQDGQKAPILHLTNHLLSRVRTTKNTHRTLRAGYDENPA